MTTQLARRDRENEVTHSDHESSRGSRIRENGSQMINSLIMGSQSRSDDDTRWDDRSWTNYDH